MLSPLSSVSGLTKSVTCVFQVSSCRSLVSLLFILHCQSWIRRTLFQTLSLTQQQQQHPWSLLETQLPHIYPWPNESIHIINKFQDFSVQSDWGKRLSATQICCSSDRIPWMTFYLGQNTISGTDNLSHGSWSPKYFDTDTFLFSFGSLNTKTSATGMMILFYDILWGLSFYYSICSKDFPFNLTCLACSYPWGQDSSCVNV